MAFMVAILNCARFRKCTDVQLKFGRLIPELAHGCCRTALGIILQGHQFESLIFVVVIMIQSLLRIIVVVVVAAVVAAVASVAAAVAAAVVKLQKLCLLLVLLCLLLVNWKKVPSHMPKQANRGVLPDDGSQ